MAESYTFGYWGSTCEEILRSQFPLHRACRDGDVESLSLLLVEAQHGIYEEDSYYGWTPAHWASYFGKLPCLMRLLDESGMNCDVASVRLKQTPSHIAAFAGRSHCLKWLLHCGASLDKQDYLGETAIHKAARTGSMECVSLLVSHGARLFIHNNTGQTPAQVAAACGYEACAHYLHAAAQQQEAHTAKGVFQQGPSPFTNNITVPSPHDIIISKKVEPCVITHAINGGRLPPPGPPPPQIGSNDGMECAMEEGEEPERTQGDQRTLSNGDIMLHQGISHNLIPVAGRKRCREDTDEIEFKRMRRADCGWEENNSCTDTETTGSECSDMGCNGVTDCNKNTPCMSDLHLEAEDDMVGYDYNGIPQDLDFPACPVMQAQALETNQQFPAKCIGLTGHFI